MYKVKPRGIDIRHNDRDVADGFLQKSINLQWRDGSYRPIPERLFSEIGSTSGKDEIIMHKVSDEDSINVLMFDSGILKWFGTITNGIYTEKVTPIVITGFPTITDFDSLSFTILNSLIYFMSTSQEFYYRLQFNEVDQVYEIKNMYAWKDLVPFFPDPGNNAGQVPVGTNTHHIISRCGIILTRFTLVLNTGEEVLHSPIYSNLMYAINRSTADFAKDDLLTNIHAIVSTNLEFLDSSIYADEISAINFYASVPYYYTTIGESVTGAGSFVTPLFGSNEIKGEVRRMAEEPFYLVKTIDNPSVDKFKNSMLFYVGTFDSDIEYDGYDLSKLNIDTIAAGQSMPVDNFSYHKLYGTITSNDGRLIIDNPKTVLSNGHVRALALGELQSKVGFHIDTEDGTRYGVAYELDKSLTIVGNATKSRGILSYPDSRANYIGGSETFTGVVNLFKSRANVAHNMSCVFNFSLATLFPATIVEDTVNSLIKWNAPELVIFGYEDADITTSNPAVIDPVFYTSENRMQFSESGEFSVWPAVNSYRVGEGKIKFIGSNSVDPANTDYIAPLLIGTSEGIYTANFDSSGVSLIQSITKVASMPALSSENIQIDQALVYVSDKGLIVINSGQLNNITKDYFPDKPSNSFPVEGAFLAEDLGFDLGGYSLIDTILPNYDLLTEGLFATDTSYNVLDIIEYLKGAIFAYDGRQNNLWCCNKNKSYSLIFNLESKRWDMSTYIFTKAIDFLGSLSTNEGDVYSRFLVLNTDGDLDVLSGEDSNEQVDVLMLTRPIKMDVPDQFKKINRLISRCELYRSDEAGFLCFGLWGKQDMNMNKVNIPLIAYRDDSEVGFPNNTRQDIPVGMQKGKYKSITILQGGKLLPSSSFDGFEIVANSVNNRYLR